MRGDGLEFTRALVQFRPHPQDAANEPSNGGGDRNPAVVDGGCCQADRTSRGFSIRRFAG
jgi:hypothetical protein